MMDIKEAAFWAKWSGLEKLHEVLRDTALTIMIQANYKNDKDKERDQILNQLVKQTLRQAIGVSGGWSVTDSIIKGDENRDLRRSLSVIHDIARLYFNVFSALEDGEHNEDLNFSSYILFEGPQAYREYAEEIEDKDERKRCLKLVKQLEKYEDIYNPDIQYPHENQPADEYFESVR